MKVEYSIKQSLCGGNAPLRRKTAQSIVEMVIGVIVLVPIVLILFDVAVLVLASSAADSLAKSACRAAASATDPATNQGNATVAEAASLDVCSKFGTSTIIQPAGGSFQTGFCYKGPGGGAPTGPEGAALAPLQPGQCGVIVTFRVSVPVPFGPLLSTVNLRAQAVEPIVALPP